MMKYCPRCNSIMSWYLTYICGIPRGGWHCDNCGYGNRDVETVTSNKTFTIGEELPKDVVEPIGNGNVIMSEETYDELIERSVTNDCISRKDLIEMLLADNECDRSEAKACMCSLDLILELIDDAPRVVPSADVVERKDFDEVVKKMGERNCFTCGTYYDGESILLIDPQEVPTKVLEENDRAVSLAEVCKIIQDTYEVCPATWGRLRNLPSIAPQAPSEDCISREWVLDKIDECYGETQYACNLAAAFEREVKSAPSVVPSREEGEWELVVGKGVKCSVCQSEYLFDASHYIEGSDFCPNCGSRMKGAKK